MAVTKPRVDRIRPAELVRLGLEGKLRIPPFQRPFRWESTDVVNLFDSILRGYPVGNLLMWERPAVAAQVTLGPLVLDAPAVADALWVVDGQQRVASLVGALAAPPTRATRGFASTSTWIVNASSPAGAGIGSGTLGCRFPSPWTIGVSLPGNGSGPG